jgi:uncharacterized protein YjiS (DUF1127 family)
MSSYSVKTQPVFAGHDLRESAVSGVGRLIKTVASWSARSRAYHQTVSELEMLSDRDLADIGVARSDIPAIARDAAKAARAA